MSMFVQLFSLWVRFRRGRDADLPPASPHAGGIQTPAQLHQRDWRSSGLLCFAGTATAFRHLSLTAVLRA